jgi:hypothetical protein
MQNTGAGQWVLTGLCEGVLDVPVLLPFRPDEVFSRLATLAERLIARAAVPPGAGAGAAGDAGGEVRELPVMGGMPAGGVQPGFSEADVKRLIQASKRDLMDEIGVTAKRTHEMMGGIGEFADQAQKDEYNELARKDDEYRSILQTMQDNGATAPMMAGIVKMKDANRLQLRCISFATRGGANAQSILAWGKASATEDPEVLAQFADMSEKRSKIMKWQKYSGQDTVFGNAAAGGRAGGRAAYGTPGGGTPTPQFASPGGYNAMAGAGMGPPAGPPPRQNYGATPNLNMGRIPLAGAAGAPTLPLHKQPLDVSKITFAGVVQNHRFMNINNRPVYLKSNQTFATPLISAAVGVPNGMVHTSICYGCGREGHYGFECPVGRKFYMAGNLDERGSLLRM